MNNFPAIIASSSNMPLIAIFAVIGFPLYVILAVVYKWKPPMDLTVGLAFVVASAGFLALGENNVSDGLAIPALFFIGSGLLVMLIRQAMGTGNNS